MTKTESSDALRAFAIVRFEGDALDVAGLDDVLRVRATLAYAKGESYSLARRGTEKIGRTGYWFLNSKTYLKTEDLNAHISLLTKTSIDSKPQSHRDHKFNHLKTIVEQNSLSVRATLFWFGRNDTRPSGIRSRLISLLDRLRGEIETDFTLKDTASSELVGHAVP